MKTHRHRVHPEVLWCGLSRSLKSRAGRVDGWSFPPAVKRLLLELTVGKRVLQLFGGKADFGTRIDIDPLTRPDVIADAWLPPFKKDAFDVVIIDPPYFTLNAQMKFDLIRNAAYCAREHVIWFHTIWIATDSSLPLESAWLVRVGDNCYVRCIQVFRVTEPKKHVTHFDRGPAMKYNRWLMPNALLPFGDPPC